MLNSLLEYEPSIFLGRLARNIANLSKELPKALLLTANTTSAFELHSSINKGKLYNFEILIEFNNLVYIRC